MQHDQFGLPIANADSGVVREYDAYVDAFLSYGADVRRIFAAADAAPTCPLVNAHAAVLHAAFEAEEGHVAARPYLARALAHKNAGSAREQAFIEAARAWIDKNFDACLGRLEAIAAQWPEDLCALKWAQYHAFNLGRAEALLTLGWRAAETHRGAPFAHGLYAFGLEQAGILEEAEMHGLRAVEIRVDDAWAHHAVAHVMDSQGRLEDGAAWMAHCAHTWDEKGVFIRHHNWWHAALFRLYLGDDAGALKIFDERLWGVWPEFPQEQIGAVSMLWRLEMAGVDVGDRWTPVVDEARARAEDHIFPFHDLHYLYALARAGAPREVDDFIVGMTRCADRTEIACAPSWREVAIPAAHGIAAFARGDFDAAAACLTAVGPRLCEIGGSHAQRAVFAQALECARKRSTQKTASVPLRA